jgi:hypothetical protein
MARSHMLTTSPPRCRRAALAAAPLLVPALLASSALAAEPDAGSSTAALLTEQILLVATVVGSVAALPALIEFLVDRRKRRERIALSLDDVEVKSLDVRLAGLDHLLADIADLLDRAKHPDAYASLNPGNEILVIGPSLGGKKTLAQRIARDAAIDRVITVYNARSGDALAKAKSLIQSYGRQKLMLLLPRIDTAFEQENEEVLTELDALIETSSGLRNVLVVGTAVAFRPDSAIDNLFGVKLVLPGTPLGPATGRVADPAVRDMLRAVARFYLDAALAAGFVLAGIDDTRVVERILDSVSNPAEVEDIVVLCQTSALHRRRIGATPRPEITREILEKSIGRVIVNVAASE